LTLDIAIIGMACVFPGARDAAEYWSAVVAGSDAVTEVPAERWPAEVYHAGDGPADRYTPSRWGGFLPPVGFDPLAYGIPPASLGSVETAQLLALDVAAAALADAGYADRAFDRERTSVIFAAEGGSDLATAYACRSLLPMYLGEVPDALDAHLPRLTEDSFPGILANLVAGRIANRLDLGGVNYTVDAACAASLAAVDLAAKELSTGTSDLVLCGAVDLHNGIHDYLLFGSAGALSPTGRCRPFDAEADGIALSEGVACVVLKRLADARREQDRIYAVIRGVAGASDGRARGLTAPRPEGQRRAILRAQTMAGVRPAEVGLVEAHGTGTVVGDRTELATLTDLFVEAGVPPGSCAVGSVKALIGHTKCAAGLAGLIKAARAIHTGVLPPTGRLDRPNPYWDGASSPLRFDTEARPWLVPRAARTAGVSAFGFGGTNFHAVLAGPEGTDEPSRALDTWPAELLVFRGADRAEAVTRIDRCAARLASGERWRLRDLARVTASDGADLPVQVAIVSTGVAGLDGQLATARRFEERDGVYPRTGPADPGAVAFLFPGQGSQRPRMLGELFVAFPELRSRLYDDPERARLLFPPAYADTRAGLTDTRHAQPALGLAGLAVRDLLRRFGIEPAMAGGHSYGELVALCAAGAVAEPDLLALSAARGGAMHAAGPGAMAAVAAGVAEVAAVLARLPDPPVLANHNGPRQVVLSGPSDTVDAALIALRDNGIPGKHLAVACAFHSPAMAGAAAAFANELRGVALRPPAIPVWANATAAPYPVEPDAIRATLVDQIVRPVRFAEQVEAMYAAGARIFVEAGPGDVLTRLVGKILDGRPYAAIPCETATRRGLTGLLHGLAQLLAAGVPVDVAELFRGRPAHGPEPAPRWMIDGPLIRTADGTTVHNGLQPAPAGVRPETVPSAAVLEFLRGTRAMLEAQRDVLLRYLGAPAPEPAPAPETVPAPEPASQPVGAPVATVDRGQSRDLLDAVRAVIGDHTGYPLDMVGPDLDLEAELGIDSLKRTAIAAALLARLGPGTADADRLAESRTPRGMAELLGTSTTLRRYVVPLDAVPDPPASGWLAGRRVRIAGDGQGVAVELATLLARHGARADPAGPDALVVLHGLGGDQPALPEAYPLIREAALGGVNRLVAATAAGADGTLAGAGLAGLLRVVAREHPRVVVRCVDVTPKDDPATIAAQLVAELDADPGGPVAVSYQAGARCAPRLVEAPLPPRQAGLGLDAESVVLLTGGARGITAHAALGLAAATGCRVEVLGRTPPPPDGAADPFPDPMALRRAIIVEGGRAPTEVEAELARRLAASEVCANLARIRASAASVRYHAVDVRDHAGVAAVVEDIYRREGRLDAVVHGAGVLHDKLLRDKTPEAFARVFGVKLDGARALVAALRPDLRYLVFFGSVAGVIGTRGQADYAAGNDALRTLAQQLSHRLDGRVLTVHWGPWAAAAGGMVSTELEERYRRSGIGLIDPAAGVEALLRELAEGDRGTTEVVYLSGRPEAFDEPPGARDA